MAIPDYQQAVVSDFDVFRTDGNGLRQQGDLDLQVIELFWPNRRKTRIMQRSAGGAVRNAFAERFLGLNDTDTAAQFAMNEKRNENTAGAAENVFLRDSIAG